MPGKNGQLLVVSPSLPPFALFAFVASCPASSDIALSLVHHDDWTGLGSSISATSVQHSLGGQARGRDRNIAHRTSCLSICLSVYLDPLCRLRVSFCSTHPYRGTSRADPRVVGRIDLIDSHQLRGPEGQQRPPTMQTSLLDHDSPDAIFRIHTVYTLVTAVSSLCFSAGRQAGRHRRTSPVHQAKKGSSRVPTDISPRSA